LTLEQTKTLSPELVREFVIAGHGNLERVKQMLTENPELLNAAYPWNEDDRETAIQAAAQVGSVSVAEYLLANGAPLDICTAAMLGRKDQVEIFLAQDPSKIQAKGAHGIPVLTHAGFGGNLELVQFLVARGATAGFSPALHNAVSRGDTQIAAWLLENTKADLNWKNFQGKTALKVAEERRDSAMARLLREYGAVE
jgi:uncharacterized protein